jgi:hypothetical protein
MVKFLHILEEQNSQKIKKFGCPKKKIKVAAKFKMATKTKFACKNYKSSFFKIKISGLF